MINREMDCEEEIKQAQARIEQMAQRIEKARTRAELAETRTELAEARTELAETRTALAETRAEQAETTLHRLVENGEPVDGFTPSHSPEGNADGTARLDGLTSRQREILKHIAEGRNTKQIADVLNLSPKTIEYHRGRLMQAVDVHDVPGLVRLAVRAGLVPAER